MRSSESGAAELASVEVDRAPDHTLVTLRGEIDLSNAELVYQQLRAAAKAEGPLPTRNPLRVSVSGLRFLDSAGISVLIRLDRDLQDRGQEVVLLVAPGCLAARTLRLAAMDKVLVLRDE